MSHQPSIVCFGEILWDVLPDRSLPGGAPMNVAYHLNKLRVDTHFISRIGDDEQGKKLLTLLDSWSLSTHYVQVDNKHKTSEVLAVEGENHEMRYEILFPVAWDFIEYDARFESLLQKADALVFGSLVTRNTVSAQTLGALLEIAKYKVFDINLRAPHYSSSTIKDLLRKTSLLKLNENELTEVTGWYNPSIKTPQDSIKLLQDEFGIMEIIVTNGSKGSTYYSPDGILSQKAYPVKVADTIGSGDSFLAGFLAGKFFGEPATVALSTAAALASFVTSHHGACPDYSIAELEQFRLAQQMS